MITLGMLLFIIIVGTSTVYNRRRRFFAEKELNETRKETQDAIKKLHKIAETNLHA